MNDFSGNIKYVDGICVIACRRMHTRMYTPTCIRFYFPRFFNFFDPLS